MKFRCKNVEYFKKLCDVFDHFEQQFEKCCNDQWEHGEYQYIFVHSQDNGSRGRQWSVTIFRTEIELVQRLKLYVWYDYSEFDNNPQNYLMLVQTSSGEIKISDSVNQRQKFMYVNKD